MTKEYTPGQDCGCYAYSESECGCGADWTPSDVHELREKLAAERALADRLAEAFKDLWDNHTMYGAGYEVVEKSLTAWKEARSE